MQNLPPTTEVRAFARAVLDLVKESGQSYEQYIEPEKYWQLRGRLLATPALAEYVAQDGQNVSLTFNGRRIYLGNIGHEQKPGIGAYGPDGSQPVKYRSRTSLKQAAKIMLDLLPQVPRTGFSESEEMAVLRAVRRGHGAKFRDEVGVLLAKANLPMKAKLVKAFPGIFHALIKEGKAK